jgi:glycosyltransferase involved in cell wall biosynthesis
LHGDASLREKLSSRAYHAVLSQGYSCEAMVARYKAVFDSLFQQRSTFRRPRGMIRMPPFQVNRVGIFEVPEVRQFDNVGVMQSRRDYEGFVRELDGTGRSLPAWTRKLEHLYPNAILSATSGRLSGVDVFSANLVRGMRALGREARVLMTSPGDLTPDPMSFPGDVPVDTLHVSRWTNWTSRWLKLKKYLDSTAPCIYIPNYDWRHSCISPLLQPKIGIVGIVHSDDPQHYEHVTRLGRYWNAIVAVSGTIASRVAELDPSLSSRLVTIPYGVDVPPSLPDRGSSAGRPLRLIYAGRLVREQKRVQDLPKIFAALSERGIPAQLSVIGSGNQEKNLRESCARWIESGHVRFLGTLANTEVARELEQSDVFVLTSEFEGLPVSLLEAMGRGCVPIVTDINSGIPDLVRDGENGFRVPVGDIKAFADSVQSLHGDPALLRRLSEGSYRAIDAGRYRTEDMVARYLEVFDRVFVEAELGLFQRPTGPILPWPNSSEWIQKQAADFPGGNWLRRVSVSVRERLGV